MFLAEYRACHIPSLNTRTLTIIVIVFVIVSGGEGPIDSLWLGIRHEQGVPGYASPPYYIHTYKSIPPISTDYLICM